MSNEELPGAVGARLEPGVRALDPERAAVCADVNASPLLQSLLYDVNLLPEQTLRDDVRWAYTVALVRHVEIGLAMEREACAALCDEQATAPECPERAAYCAAAIRERSNVRAKRAPAARTKG